MRGHHSAERVGRPVPRGAVYFRRQQAHPLLMPSPPEPPPPPHGDHTAFRVLGALSFCHLLNDMMQSLLPAIYPMLKSALRLDFGQIGLITLVYQLTASLLQPVVGLYTDRRPLPYSLADRHGVHAGGTVAAGVVGAFGAVLAAAGADRHRVVGVPSRVLAHRTPRLGRTARIRAVALSGRRQCRIGDGPAAGGLHRVAARTAQPRVVLRRAVRGHRVLWRVGGWYGRRAVAAGAAGPRRGHRRTIS